MHYRWKALRAFPTEASQSTLFVGNVGIVVRGGGDIWLFCGGSGGEQNDAVAVVVAVENR